MKIYALISCCFFQLPIFAQRFDTLLYKKEKDPSTNSFYTVVYIDTSSKVRSELTYFGLSKEDILNNKEQINSWKKSKDRGLLYKGEFPLKWVQIHIYKGSYYLYKPSDYGNHYRFKISDSTTLDFSMDNPHLSLIKHIWNPSRTELIIERKDQRGYNYVRIKYIDKRKGLALFSFSSKKNSDIDYEILMVDINKIHLYPTLVIYSNAGKVDEFDFDK